MLKLWAITTNAFVETIRQPIFLILLLVTFGVLLLDVPLAAYSMDVELQEGDIRLLVDLGLSTLMMSGLFIAAFSASGILAREIEDRTVLTVVSKPVPRPLVLLGKFLGVLAAVTIAHYLASLVFLMTVRHGVLSAATHRPDMVVILLGVSAFVLSILLAAFVNYFFGWQFTSSVIGFALVLMTLAAGFIGFLGRDWTIVPFAEGIPAALPLMLLLLWMAILLITALAVAISTRLGQLATLGLCLGGFLLSMVVHGFLAAHVEGNFLARVVYWMLPNLNYFFPYLPDTQEQAISGSYLLLAGGYAVSYSVALLLIGMALLQTREMDRRETGSLAPSMVNAMAWVLRAAGIGCALVGLSLAVGRQDAVSLVVGGALLAGALALWLWSGYVGAGVRWALIVLWLVTAVQFIGSVVYVLFLRPAALSPMRAAQILLVSIALTIYVIVMSLRSGTREHFRRQPSAGRA